MTITYENRLTAYVDILGWSEAIKTESALSLYNALKPIIERAAFNSQPHRNALLEKYGNKINPLMLEVQFGFFSDCLVLSIPVSMEGRIYDVISHISMKLLQRGFAVRGGISAGELFHNDQIIFGPALIEAHKIESQQANFPRVMIDPRAIEATGINPDYSIMTDPYNDWVVDMFPYQAKAPDMRNLIQQFYDPDLIIEVITTKLLSTQNIQTSNEKWRYQATLCAESLKKYGAASQDWVYKLEKLVN